VKKLGNPC